MIAMLMAAAAAFVVVVFFTPLLIRRAARRGIGQQIRDDGPIEHPHVAKAGTPTMGGIAIVVATVVGYCSRTSAGRASRSRRPGWALHRVDRRARVVGWIDDYLGVRARRNLGLRKRGKTSGIVVVAAGASRGSRVYFVHTDTHSRSPGRSTSTSARSGCSSGPCSSCTRPRTRSTSPTASTGSRPARRRFTFAAFVIIAFTEFRHPDIYRVVPAQALDQAVVAAAMFGAVPGSSGGTRRPAQIFMGDTGSLAIGGAMAGLRL